jgi:hypothetical protein
MSTRELEDLLAFNMRNTHVSEIYVDDYYYEAYINKYFHGLNTRRFRPLKLFALAPHERNAAEEAAHAKVDGLGKFVYASLRTPRQLLAVDARPTRRKAAQRNPFPETIAEVLDEVPDSKAKESTGGGTGNPTAPGTKVDHCTLQTDGQVAARKVIEDCNCQLLDVDDADRAIASHRVAAAEGEVVHERDVMYFLERRWLLMDGIADALRIRDEEGGSDGVFRFIAGTNKGRVLIARVLARVGTFGGRVHGLSMLLGTLRNARALFGDNLAPPPTANLIASDEQIHISSAVDVATAAAAALARLHSPEDVLRCFQALRASDVVAEIPRDWSERSEQLGIKGLLPLLLLHHNYQIDKSAAWFGMVLIALFEAAARVGVSAGATAEPFRVAFLDVFNRIMAHLMALIGLLEKACATQVQEAIDSVCALVGSSVLHAMLEICTPEQEKQLALPLSVIVGNTTSAPPS